MPAASEADGGGRDVERRRREPKRGEVLGVGAQPTADDDRPLPATVKVACTCPVEEQRGSLGPGPGNRGPAPGPGNPAPPPLPCRVKLIEPASRVPGRQRRRCQLRLQVVGRHRKPLARTLLLV